MQDIDVLIADDSQCNVPQGYVRMQISVRQWIAQRLNLPKRDIEMVKEAANDAPSYKEARMDNNANSQRPQRMLMKCATAVNKGVFVPDKRPYHPLDVAKFQNCLPLDKCTFLPNAKVVF